MTELPYVWTAMALATHAHKGQVDKAGRPYIEHPLRVMERFEDPVLRAIAVLHDVVEDKGEVYTLGALRAEGFGERVVAAVDALTHRKGESRADYYERVKANPDALRVKLADIEDNADPERLAVLDEVTRLRLERKYAEAREALEGRR